MTINSQQQFNQEVDQYKLLSSTYGVGAIIPTKMGVFIMPLSIELWDFIMRAKQADSSDPKKLKQFAVTPISNPSFLRYLQEKEGMTNLKTLVAIPHMQLDEYNRQEYEQNPLFQDFKENNPGKQFFDSVFSVPAILFPRWMYSPKDGRLQELDDWKKEWKASHNNSLRNFAPPMDAKSRTSYTNKKGEPVDRYSPLKQMQLVLACPNGHISDIPWDKFFSASHDPNVGDKLYDEGFDLFGYSDTTCSCGGKHSLEFSENIGHTEGFGYVRCTKCKKKTSLEGILNLRPLCSKEMPWRRRSGNEEIPVDSTCRLSGKPGVMRVLLNTSPSIYFADAHSGLFIPDTLNEKEQKALSFLNTSAFPNFLISNPSATKQDWWKTNGGDGSIKIALQMMAGISLSDSELNNIKNRFLHVSSESDDKEEEMKFAEYDIFANQDSVDSENLKANTIDLPNSLLPYFAKISQIPLLCITKTQLNFFRVQSPAPTRNDKGGIDYPEGQKLSQLPKDKITVYPAIQEYGEGLFFQFNEETLKTWDSLISTDEASKNRYREKEDDEKNNILSVMLGKYGNPHRFYMLHTFAHSIIKEMEFSCGYPSASLSERIYFSNRMCGVLIYTAEGSEGSMGGLVWQGKSALIERTIKRAMDRARHCSSDPICWERDKETMNLAACFSCEMISETSCEFRNMGLDRQALVNDSFGYFRKLSF